ncbi:MAG: hypothetical protein Q7V57_03995 [Actinomycetota bacterium]|nr:hypothetical protein [Actinomycetota bacterium]
MRRVIPLVALAVAALSSCGGDDGSDSSDMGSAATTSPTAAQGLCTTITEAHFAPFFSDGIGPGVPEGTDFKCNWPAVTDNGANRGRLFVGTTSIPYDKTVADSEQLGQAMTDVDGLGDRAHFTVDGGLMWITLELEGTVHSVAVEYFDTAGMPPTDEVEAALRQLATDYLASR